jgi:hypothetical protein
MGIKFETIGWHVDYLVSGKYIGSLRLQEKDREIIGYNGRIKTTLEQDITLVNGKKIKKGVEVVTEIFPLNGKLI